MNLDEIKAALKNIRADRWVADWENGIIWSNKGEVVLNFDANVEEDDIKVIENAPQWLASLVEENERLTRFCNEWASGEDKFQEFGGWERIDEMKSEIASLRSQLVEVEQPKQRLLSELHNERIKKDQFLNERNALKAQLEEVQKTLEWYADEVHYLKFPGIGIREDVVADRGVRARETLKRLRGEQTT